MDATPFLPERINLRSLRTAAADCRGCDLHAPATQTVFGEGRKASRVMLVGEVPGERGRALDCALAPFVTATIHPSAILRARDEDARAAEREAFRSDLALAAAFLRGEKG